MGLDMYLLAKISVSDFGKDAKLNTELKKSLGFEPKEYDHLYIDMQVAYWRKSNQIHSWFVDNVQNGVDDCGTYYVVPTKLQELLNLCKTAIKTKDSTLLQPKGGFFFGSTTVDEYYWSDLDATVEKLTLVLEDKRLEPWSFQYHASW